MKLNQKLILVPGQNAKKLFPRNEYYVIVTESNENFFAVTFENHGRLTFKQNTNECSILDPKTSTPLEFTIKHSCT